MLLLTLVPEVPAITLNSEAGKNRSFKAQV